MPGVYQDSSFCQILTPSRLIPTLHKTGYANHTRLVVIARAIEILNWFADRVCVGSAHCFGLIQEKSCTLYIVRLYLGLTHLLRIAKQMNIIIKIRNNYGKKVAYPACKKAHMFASIAGTSTLTADTITIIRSLGYQITVATPNLEGIE